MIENTLIPSVDPIPLPAPLWLLKFLLIFTFILHIIPMNFALGGGFMAAICHTLGKWKKDQRYLLLAGALSKIIPYSIAATITFGVAPLLFLQLIYGQFFYTSSILMAWPWLSIIVLLILGYYGFYRCYFHVQKKESVPLWLPWTSALLFLVIGFLYTRNLVLMLTPEKWQEIYVASPYGTHLDIQDATVIPRFLHFFIASLALSGILVVFYGLWKKKGNTEQGKWAIRFGSQWFSTATLVQFFVGLWFLAALPQPIQQSFMGGDRWATTLLITGIVSAVFAMMMFLSAAVSEKPGRKIIIGTAFISLTIVSMAVIRDFVRSKYLEPYFNVAQQVIRPQWDVFVIFVALLVGAAVTVGWMILRVIKEK